MILDVSDLGAYLFSKGPQPEQSGPPIGSMYNGMSTPDERVAAVVARARGICISLTVGLKPVTINIMQVSLCAMNEPQNL